MLHLRGAVAIGVVAAQFCALHSSSAEAQAPDRASQATAPVGRWRLAGSMNERREYAGGIRLDDGRILAVSGHPLEGQAVASAELYDPATDTWTATGSLREARNSGNTTVLLKDGRVLLPGGNTNTRAIRGVEIYDPATGKWSDAGNLSAGRDTKAAVLQDGRVLVAGGIDWTIGEGKAFDLAELYDPISGQWTTTGSMRQARYAHQMVSLDDGRVLALGGYREGDVLLASAELYDPQTQTWQLTEEMPSPRVAFGALKLKDGRVLLAGGVEGPSWKERVNVARVSLYDPATGRWSEAAPMEAKRAGFSLTELPDGRVLAAGGWAQSQREFQSAEIYDPRTDTWRPTAPMNVARRNHRAALLPGGRVLVIGGSSGFGSKYLTSCEIFELTD